MLTLQLYQFLHEEAVEIVRWLGDSRIRHDTVLVRPTLEQPHVHVDDLVVQPAAGDQAANMHAQQPNFALGSTGRAIEDHSQSHLPVVKFFLVSWVNTAIHRIPDPTNARGFCRAISLATALCRTVSFWVEPLDFTFINAT